jgi:hypothetical protein
MTPKYKVELWNELTYILVNTVKQNYQLLALVTPDVMEVTME